MHKSNISSGRNVPSKRPANPGRVSAKQHFPPPPACPNGFIYTVQSGDTMFLIAQRFGVTLNALIAANPQVADPNLIFPGQQLCVPTGAPGPGPVPPPPPPCPNGFIYTVQSGDTLFFIAQRFGVTLNALIAANPQIPDPNLIFPGQRICVPTGPVPPVPPPPPPCPPPGFLYTVQPGDSLFLIAQRFGTTLNNLIACNPQIPDPNLIFPGQVICVCFAPVPPPPPPCPPPGFLYTVQPGDSLFLIAQRFGTTLDALIACNPQIPDPNLIFPGQVICVCFPGPPQPFCPVILFATSNAPNSMGCAFLIPSQGYAFIFGHNLPVLPGVGETYTGWIRDTQTGAVVRIPLSESTEFPRNWLGMQASGPSFLGYEEVFVTREPVVEPPPSTPTGPRMIQGSMTQCTN